MENTNIPHLTDPGYFQTTAVDKWDLLDAYSAFSAANPGRSREEVSDFIMEVLQVIATKSRKPTKAERASRLLSAFSKSTRSDDQATASCEPRPVVRNDFRHNNVGIFNQNIMG